MMDENVLYKLSSDIEFSKFSEKEYLLYNQKLHTYTKINQKYYDLLGLADGKRTLIAIREEFQERHNILLSDNQIVSLFNRLKKQGVFGYDDSVKQRVKIPNYIKFGFIFLKSNMVSRIVPFLSFLFRKKIYIPLMILGIIVFCLNLYSNYYQYRELNIVKIFPYFVVLIFVSIIFHELGHATAAHYYKAKHGGIGFGFYLYFLPVFFADVTDIWRLERWKRIIVNSAGIYFEVIFCLILSIIGFFTKNHVLQILGLVISGKALYNLLPFLRADGYWILSDLFNKPNLNFHSFNNLKIMVTFWLKGVRLKFDKVDYFIAFYGLFNISLIGFFFYYQIVLNGKSIIYFPKTIQGILTSLADNQSSMSFRELTKCVSILVFYIIFIKIFTGLGKKAFKSIRKK